MSRRTWKKGNLYISFGRPSITPFNENKPVISQSDVMYFYYDIDILSGSKTMFKADTSDFPKVQNLPFYIDEIVNFDMKNAYLLEDIEVNGFTRQKRYHQVMLEDSFGFDIEYFYKIERYDYDVKQAKEELPKKWSEYILTIGQMEKSRQYGGDNREDYGKTVMVQNLDASDLMRLKDTALQFCEEAMRVHNKFVKVLSLSKSKNNEEE